uniref:F-box domain-containing protein n=1 Tax=Ditylenchus dipsaci TaxID=166011 RepID=A0A915D5U5_9BILA
MNLENFRSVLAFLSRQELQQLSLVNRQVAQFIQREFGDAPYIWLDDVYYEYGKWRSDLPFHILLTSKFLRFHVSFLAPSSSLEIIPQSQHLWQDSELRATFNADVQLTTQVAQAMANSWNLCLFSTADGIIGSALNVLQTLLKGNCEQISLEDNTWTPELGLPAISDIVDYMFKPVRRKRAGREKFRVLRIYTAASPTNDFCQQLVKLMKKKFLASGLNPNSSLNGTVPIKSNGN